MLSLLKRLSLFLFISLIFASCSGVLSIRKATNWVTIPDSISRKDFNLKSFSRTGADNFHDYLPLLRNKTIGIVTNQTGVVITVTDSTKGKKLKKVSNHIVDFLIDKKITIKSVFSPEHGFRGNADAGELLTDSIDSQSKLPIVSLYGKNKKPSSSQLKGIDVMLFDIQDVGVRFYTYISTLHYIMEACAENHIPLIVLDRPNPNGSLIDGPVLEKEFESFVGLHPVPILYGMTIGEYAQMINGEGWLKNSIRCDLTVIRCANYNRNMFYHISINPSPNLPNDTSINLYASLCFFEGTNVSIGRGTKKQFQIYGSPYLPKTEFSFVPKPHPGAKNPLYNTIECFGEDLTHSPRISKIELKWLNYAYKNSKNKESFFNPFFSKLAGNNTLQKQIEENISERKIRKSWRTGLKKFKKYRKKYLIY